MPLMIPLQLILLPRSITDFLGVEITSSLLGQGFMIDQMSSTFPLTRMNDIMKCSLDKLPPVSLQPLLNTNYYIILNGRHRVTYAILQNKGSIMANIVFPLN